MSSVVVQQRQKAALAAVQKQNKTCFNCGSLANYAVFPVGITVCPNCSGAHRDIGHTVKGFTTSKFSPQDVELLQKFGNNVAAEVWLASWKANGSLNKPRPQDARACKQWISAVFQSKQFYSEAAMETARTSTKKPTLAPPSSTGSFALPMPSSRMSTANSGQIARTFTSGQSEQAATPAADSKGAAASPADSKGAASPAAAGPEEPEAAAPEESAAAAAAPASPAASPVAEAPPPPTPLPAPAPILDLLGDFEAAGAAEPAPAEVAQAPMTNGSFDPFGGALEPSGGPDVAPLTAECAGKAPTAAENGDAFDPFGNHSQNGSFRDTVFDPFSGGAMPAQLKLSARPHAPHGPPAGPMTPTTPAQGFHPFSSSATPPLPAGSTISKIPSDLLSALAPSTPRARDAFSGISPGPSAAVNVLQDGRTSSGMNTAWSMSMAAAEGPAAPAPTPAPSMAHSLSVPQSSLAESGTFNPFGSQAVAPVLGEDGRASGTPPQSPPPPTPPPANAAPEPAPAPEAPAPPASKQPAPAASAPAPAALPSRGALDVNLFTYHSVPTPPPQPQPGFMQAHYHQQMAVEPPSAQAAPSSKYALSSAMPSQQIGGGFGQAPPPPGPYHPHAQQHPAWPHAPPPGGHYMAQPGSDWPPQYGSSMRMQMPSPGYGMPAAGGAPQGWPGAQQQPYGQPQYGQQQYGQQQFYGAPTGAPLHAMQMGGAQPAPLGPPPPSAALQQSQGLQAFPHMAGPGPQQPGAPAAPQKSAPQEPDAFANLFASSMQVNDGAAKAAAPAANGSMGAGGNPFA